MLLEKEVFLYILKGEKHLAHRPNVFLFYVIHSLKASVNCKKGLFSTKIKIRREQKITSDRFLSVFVVGDLY